MSEKNLVFLAIGVGVVMAAAACGNETASADDGSASAGDASDTVTLEDARIDNARRALTVGPDEIDTVSEIYTADMVYEEPVLRVEGIDNMVSFLENLLALTPDYNLEINDEIYAGDMYSATWVMTGTLLGAAYTAPGMSICKFAPDDARIYYQRDYYSEGDVWAEQVLTKQMVADMRGAFELMAIEGTAPQGE